MQVVLNLNDVQLTDNVVEIFNTLTETQKQEIAFKVIESWIYSADNEFEFKKRQLIEHYMKNKKRGRWSESENFENESQVLSDYSFQEELRKVKTSKTVFMENLYTEQSNYYKRKLDALFSTPEFQEKIETEFKTISNKFPELLTSAMTNFFIGNMNLIQNLSSQLQNKDNNSNGY